MITTTTSSLEGYAIEEYLGPISAHVVAGTNFFSDLFAGFSDFFGGRSGSYKKQLASIREEALVELERYARQLRANAIVGLHIDMDEVSGGGKSMFMVTASGTAVKVRGLGGESSINVRTTRVASGEQVQMQIRRNMIMDKVRSADHPRDALNYDIVRQSVEYGMTELIPYLAPVCGSYPEDSEYNKGLRELFRMQSVDEALSSLRELFESGDPGARKVAFREMRALNLAELSLIVWLLSHDDVEVRQYGLLATQSYASTYKPDDLATLDEVEQLINTRFPDLAEEYEKRGLTGTKTVWKCAVCGRENNLDITQCPGCSRDRRGIKANVTPEKALARVSSIRRSLRDLFGEAVVVEKKRLAE